ncbi:L-aminoadipate-semialdehyde dehydrogenase-phosphopantetheinyl transferase [Drosophila pseudoobscura]|uniref:L-aminoadipate-semialdehyde dehydrogenase-phosphopantetheinyl transferase n=1 Tax=Drosophila pseudoobscura pseudoobscura TaxID=46245 RepID=I5AMQ8_DROPS|nr:L-aminoadipate-semialdehyde dehydrogenase-phosphopantetheinyl transferase [Drosophila pseudoobscura]
MSRHVCTRWAFDLGTWTPTLPQLTQAVAAIQPEERTRLMKFHFIDDFLSSLIGRLLMRKYVSVCTATAYHQVQFARDVRGKPYWVRGQSEAAEKQPPPPLSFNVSHQGRLVLLAGITTDTDTTGSEAADFGIGTDVMKIEYGGGKPLSDFFRLMKGKFSAQEWSYIGRPQHNEPAQLKAFMRHWCLKEAYVKELGVGITVDLEKISFSVDTTHSLVEAVSPLIGTTLRCNDKPMDNWHFEEHLLEEKYCAAIAFRNCLPQDHARFEMLRFDELIVKSADAAELDSSVVDYCKEALLKPHKSDR